MASGHYGLFRSEEMQYLQVFLQSEGARYAMEELGELGCVQFRDLNPNLTAFQRNFTGEVQKLNNLQRRLVFFEEQMELSGIEPASHVHTLTEEKTLNEVMMLTEDMESDVRRMSADISGLNRRVNEINEHLEVLQRCREYFGRHGRASQSNLELQSDLGLVDEPPITDVDGTELKEVEDPGSVSTVGYLTGVVRRDVRPSFERVIFRALRGNVYLRFIPLDSDVVDPIGGELQSKDVFLIFYSGRRSKDKIRKICDSFSALTYPFPENYDEWRATVARVKGDLRDVERVVHITKKRRADALISLTEDIEDWITRVKRETAIYHHLNMFNYDHKRKCLIGEGWCPLNRCEDIQQALLRAKSRSGLDVPMILNKIQAKPKEVPPTYFETTPFTQGFQTIVDTYGVASYREYNPGVFSIITFPFLFAVMFGDVGHGILLTLFAVYVLVAYKNCNPDTLGELESYAYTGRYLIFLMGLFSIYTGSIYNDIFSCSLDVFGTHWHLPEGQHEYVNKGGVYFWGMDPAWKGAANQLVFYNSFKMKTSIILGVIQMTMGILVKYKNDRFFKQWKNIWCEFVPQLLFMTCTFGYLSLCIFIKWSTNWDKVQPPSLINMLINMFMGFGALPPGESALFPLQEHVQRLLVCISAVCVPWMLIPKPVLLFMEHKMSESAGYTELEAIGDDDEEDINSEKSGPIADGEEGDGFELMEIVVHQAIHTIEFVLGAISNTASYLRLWALSLAHAQLSEVFWEMMFIPALNMSSPIVRPVAAYIGFAVWTAATFAVLMGMESLSAFLHALRLHWVEFMSKFYNMQSGSGWPFQPFDFKKLNQEDDE